MSAKMKFSIVWILVLSFQMFYGQNMDTEWYPMEKMPIQGKIGTQGTLPFQRFPEEMKQKIRPQVWELSKNSAGLYVDFFTNATNIQVEYQVTGSLSFPHMPATGVSGVDLYTKDAAEKWHWVRGNYSFGDTISYRFKGIDSTARVKGRLYRLYLPLYNTIKWMKMGIPRNSSLEPVNNTIGSKPVVVYGTSIVQGACATRPGMAWTSILSRELKQPIINLGFSGNGRLEPEIIDYMTRIGASVYVLDCMANFTSGQGLNPKEAKLRLLNAVKDIRKKQPSTPILMVEHAGYADGEVQQDRLKTYTDLNRATKQAFQELKDRKVKSVYLLKKSDMDLGINSFVDGTHPNDYGMLQYAEACLKSLLKIALKN